MICIKDIEVFEAERDEIYIALHEKRCLVKPINFDKIGPIEVKKEMVRGRIYRNNNGQEVCIGMTEKVQKLLGIPFDDFELIRNNNEKLLNDIDNLIKEINSLNYQLAEKQEIIDSVEGNKIKLLDLRRK